MTRKKEPLPTIKAWLAAAAKSDPAAIARMRKAGMNVNARDAAGQTALLVAAKRGQRAVVIALLKEGAEVDAQDQDGMTPLVQAFRLDHSDIVRLLLDAGADIHHRPSKSLSVAELAEDWLSKRPMLENHLKYRGGKWRK